PDAVRAANSGIPPRPERQRAHREGVPECRRFSLHPEITPQRPHCLAGHVRLELANVILKKPLKMLGEFSLDYGTFWDQRLFALELRRRGYAARAYCDDLQQAFPCGRWLRRATSLRRHN